MASSTTLCCYESPFKSSYIRGLRWQIDNNKLDRRNHNDDDNNNDNMITPLKVIIQFLTFHDVILLFPYIMKELTPDRSLSSLIEKLHKNLNKTDSLVMDLNNIWSSGYYSWDETRLHTWDSDKIEVTIRNYHLVTDIGDDTGESLNFLFNLNALNHLNNETGIISCMVTLPGSFIHLHIPTSADNGDLIITQDQLINGKLKSQLGPTTMNANGKYKLIGCVLIPYIGEIEEKEPFLCTLTWSPNNDSCTVSRLSPDNKILYQLDPKWGKFAIYCSYWELYKTF
jgi:hypothetical protein